jgi:hypothetical protein
MKLTEEEWSKLNNGSHNSTNLSDDHTKQTLSDKYSSSTQLPQQEISDEEIQEYANEKYAEVKKLLPYSHFSIDNLESHFIDGMKFYREQLKNKL